MISQSIAPENNLCESHSGDTVRNTLQSWDPERVLANNDSNKNHLCNPHYISCINELKQLAPAFITRGYL